MSTQRKAKKPARIKGRLVAALMPVKTNEGLTLRFVEHTKYLELPIDNPDALVEQVASAIAKAMDSKWPTLYRSSAMAALRSIGVPIKKGKKP